MRSLSSIDLTSIGLTTPRDFSAMAVGGSLVVRALDSRPESLAHGLIVEVEIGGVAIYHVEVQSSSGSGNFPSFLSGRTRQQLQYHHTRTRNDADAVSGVDKVGGFGVQTIPIVQ
ncbi:hypothetical protein TNCV_4871121 [Trichonephila clavipes]|nr:hypothetical protein TNCV_4871121 [Trichonephila clavipes]